MTTPTPSPSEAMRLAEEQAWQWHLATMPEGARRNVMESAARGESETRKAHSSAYLAALASTQAAEVERLTRELQEMTDDRDSWLQQADDRAADALRFAKESEALKARQIDVEAVMRLADEYAAWKAAHEEHATPGSLSHMNAARDALRASLLGDGGTL